MARFRVVLVAIAAFSLAVATGWWAGGEPTRYQATVIDVIDGDTIVVDFANATTVTVRILGIDTPETKHPEMGVECFGPEASDYAKRRLMNAHVRIEFDRERTDKYGRTLAHVYRDGSRFSDELLAAGLAEWFVLPPNGRYSRTQLQLELVARARDVGMWGAC